MSDRYVYFVRPVGLSSPVKIGCSNLPMRRLEALAAWSPSKLEVVATIPGDFKLERNIHDCLADLHSHHEWFEDDGRIATIIEKLLAGVPIAEAMDLGARRNTPSAKARYWQEHPEARRRTSYTMRVGWAERKHSKGGYIYEAPDEIHAILNSWRPWLGVPPRNSDEDYAKLDAFLADPLSQMTIRPRQRKAA